MKCCFFGAGNYELSADILQSLTKVPRFQTIAMFLGKHDKTGEETRFHNNCL